MPSGAKKNDKAPGSHRKSAEANDPASIAEVGRTLRAASGIYRQRRRRDELFGVPDLFGEPAWDILLDLYIAGGRSESVSVSSACVAACVPPTTALRYLARLEQLGLVERTADKTDKRRVLVTLTRPARITIERYLEGMDSPSVV